MARLLTLPRLSCSWESSWSGLFSPSPRRDTLSSWLKILVPWVNPTVLLIGTVILVVRAPVSLLVPLGWTTTVALVVAVEPCPLASEV